MYFRLVSVLLVSIGLLAGCASVTPRYTYSTPAAGVTPTLYVVGDSTAAAYGRDRYPLFGWAQVLPYYFEADALHVEDRAISGRSSKSFYEEGAWTPIREALRPGDFVFIQFGHNDQKSDDPKRYTEPGSTYEEYLTRYINETRAAGANPVLLTPIHRNSWHTPKEVKDSHGDYPDAVRALARKEGLPVIDMHARTERYMERLGQARSTRLFINLPPALYPIYPEGKPDNTHLQEKGAYAFSALAIDAIREQRLPLRDFLKPAHQRSHGKRSIRW